MSVNFSNVSEVTKTLKKIDDVVIPMSEDIIENIDITPFKVDYSKPSRPVYALDGSYMSLWKRVPFPIWMTLIRTATVKREYDPSVPRIKMIHNNYTDNFHIVNMIKSGKVEGLDEELAKAKKEGKVDIYMNKMSNLKEIEHAMRIAKENKNTLIFFDGSISTWMEKIVDICEKNNNIIIGLSKDSKVSSNDGIMRDEDLLDFVTRKRGITTGYYKLSENEKFGTCFARLHKRADKWFKIDYMKTEQMSVEEILGEMAKYSIVKRKLGHPEPQYNAHEIAVGIRQFSDQIFKKVEYYLSRSGFTKDEIYAGRTDVNGGTRKGIYHDMLDIMSRKKGNKYSL